MKSSARIPGFRLLHSPGPTHVPDAVVSAMARQPTDLADPRLALLIDACESGMKELLQTKRAEVFFYAANGHGGWEAVIANLVAPGSTVLIPGTGHFSDNWAEQVEAFGGKAVRTSFVEGSPIDPAALEAVLRDDSAHRIGAVFVVHTDTASGTTCDLAALRRAIDAARHPALFVVDVVASLGAAPFAMDELGVNVVIGASQKGLMIQPGLAFVAADEQAMAMARANPAPRFYWDWARRVSDHSYRKFCGTPPLAHLAGLEAALGLIAVEGLDNVHARHARLARRRARRRDALGRGWRPAPVHEGAGGALGVGDGDRGLAGHRSGSLARRRARAFPGRHRRRPRPARRPRLSHRPPR